jgi:hypothetical protein
MRLVGKQSREHQHGSWKHPAAAGPPGLVSFDLNRCRLERSISWPDECPDGGWNVIDALRSALPAWLVSDTPRSSRDGSAAGYCAGWTAISIDRSRFAFMCDLPERRRSSRRSRPERRFDVPGTPAPSRDCRRNRSQVPNSNRAHSPSMPPKTKASAHLGMSAPPPRMRMRLGASPKRETDFIECSGGGVGWCEGGGCETGSCACV